MPSRPGAIKLNKLHKSPKRFSTGVPVIFGVLTTENQAQAEERADLARMNKGRESLEAALEMIELLSPPARAPRAGKARARKKGKR